MLLLGLTLVFPLLQSLGAQQRSDPVGPVTIVHPFTAGGTGYDLAHVIGSHLKEEYNIDVVVEPKPGGNTVIGALSVVRAEPDGHSLLINTMSILSMSGTIYKDPPYNPAVDLTPVAVVAKMPLILVVNSRLPINSLADLANVARTTPEGLTFSSVGIGSAQHLSGELLKRTLGLDLIHVPYRGGVPATTAVAGGHIAMMFADPLNALPLIKAGTIRPLAVTGADRLDVLGDVPTFAELGQAGFEFDLRFGIFAPAKTPPEVIADLNSKIRVAMHDSKTRARFSEQGIQLIETPSPSELKVIVSHEIAFWSKLLQDAGLARSL
jgi:tripartite-type tricarboxylate transporter receptor subunit TctC